MVYVRSLIVKRKWQLAVSDWLSVISNRTYVLPLEVPLIRGIEGLGTV